MANPELSLGIGSLGLCARGVNLIVCSHVHFDPVVHRVSHAPGTKMAAGSTGVR